MIVFTKNCKPVWTLCTLFHQQSLNKINSRIGSVFYSTELELIKRPNLRFVNKKKIHKIGPAGWILLVVPVASIALGTWQIKRKMWKEDLIKKLKDRTNMEPVDFPKNLEEIKDMEYMPVKIKGKFDHSKELYIGPRSRIDNAAYSGSLLSTPKGGYVVITPFTLSDRKQAANLTILVNRGWVPPALKSPSTRQAGQVTDEVELVGMIRLPEKRQPLGIKNAPEKGIWIYKDLEKMSEVTGAAPYMVDAARSSSIPGGPVGGQTTITLENQHLVYILTWYTLGFTTGYMWYVKYIKLFL